MSEVQVKMQFLGDSASLDKSLDRAAKKLDNTKRKAAKTRTEVKGLGDSFTKAANNVTIFNGQLDPISGRLSAIGTGINRFGIANIAMGVGITATAFAVTKLISASEQFEQRQNKFNSLLQATGYSARLTRDDLEGLAQSVARNTLGDVASTSEGINALLTFRKVQGDVFKETIRLAADAKVAFGGNLREGVVAFGKALNDPIANLGALSRKGIQFTGAQKEMITSFWETGDAAAAQNIILEEMRNQFGGLAEDEGTDLQNTMDSLGQSWENFMVSLGNKQPIETISKSWRGLLQITDEFLQFVTDEHDPQVAIAEERAELVEEEIRQKNKLLRAEQNLANVRNSNSGAQAIKDAENGVANVRTGYERARSKLAEFEFGLKKETLAGSAGLVKTLAGEVDEINSKNKAIIKSYDKRRIALLSGFEDQRDKTNRIHQQKTKALSDDFEKANKTADVGYKKQIELFEKAEKNRQLIADAESKRLGDTWYNQVARDKLMQDLADKNLAANIERDKFIEEHNQKQFELAKDYADTMVQSEEGRIAKLAKIAETERKAEEAEALRKERASQKLINAERRRSKLLSEIENGTGGPADIKSKYQQDIIAVEEAQYTIAEIEKAGFESRQDLVDYYVYLRTEAYDDEINAFNTKEEAQKELQSIMKKRRYVTKSYMRKMIDVDLEVPPYLKGKFWRIKKIEL